MGGGWRTGACGRYWRSRWRGRSPRIWLSRYTSGQASTSRLPRLPPPLIRAHGEAIRIMMAAQTERAIADWPTDAPKLVVVRAVAEREATFAVGAGDRYLRAGYDATKRALGDRFGRG